MCRCSTVDHMTDYITPPPLCYVCTVVPLMYGSICCVQYVSFSPHSAWEETWPVLEERIHCSFEFGRHADLKPSPAHRPMVMGASSLQTVVGRVPLADLYMSTAGHPVQSSQILPTLTWALIFPDCLLSKTTTQTTTLALPLSHSTMTSANTESCCHNSLAPFLLPLHLFPPYLPLSFFFFLIFVF